MLTATAPLLLNPSDVHPARRRWMDPTIGRFTSFDDFEGSIADPAHLHKYNYAGGNPVMHVDPGGHDFTLASTLAYTGVQVGLWAHQLAGAMANINAAISLASSVANWTQVTIATASGTGQPLTIYLWGGVQPGVEGLLPWVGTTLMQDSVVRKWYVENVRLLDKADKIGRDRLIIQARRITSPVGRGIAEWWKPLKSLPNKVGTASKTSEAFNRFYARAGKAAPALLIIGATISIVEIATATDPWRQAFREAGSWVGALSFGYAGAQAGLGAGTLIGGPLGGAIGGLAGGIAGAIYGSSIGEQAGDNYYEFFYDP